MWRWRDIFIFLKKYEENSLPVKLLYKKKPKSFIQTEKNDIDKSFDLQKGH